MTFVRILPLLVTTCLAGCVDAGLSGKGATVPGQSPKGTGGGGSGGADGSNGDALGTVDENGDKGKGKSGSLQTGDDKTKDSGLTTDETDLGCGTQKLKTSVKLLSTTIANGAPNERMEYEISVVDCNGKRRSVDADFILFDIDAVVDDTISNDYTLSQAGAVVTGTLQVVNGVDLFGVSGPEYFHHRTDKKIALKGDGDVARLTINLMGQEFSADGDDDGSFQVKTFLRFGSAEPVEQLVTFTE